MKTSVLKSTFNNGTGFLGTTNTNDFLVKTPDFRFNNQPAIDFLDKVRKQLINRVYFTPQTDHGLRIFKVKITTPSRQCYKTDLLICRSTYEYAYQYLSGKIIWEPILTGEEDYWAFKNEDFGFTMLQLENKDGNKLIVDYERTRKSNGYYLYGYTSHLCGYMKYRVRWTKEVDDFLNENNLIQRQCL